MTPSLGQNLRGVLEHPWEWRLSLFTQDQEPTHPGWRCSPGRREACGDNVCLRGTGALWVSCISWSFKLCSAWHGASLYRHSSSTGFEWTQEVARPCCLGFGCPLVAEYWFWDFSQFLLPGDLWNPTVFTVISGLTLRNSVLRTRSLRAWLCLQAGQNPWGRGTSLTARKGHRWEQSAWSKDACLCCLQYTQKNWPGPYLISSGLF